MRTEFFLTCMICGYQEIVDRKAFKEKKKRWSFFKEGMVCPRCRSFPHAVEQMRKYRKSQEK